MKMEVELLLPVKDHSFSNSEIETERLFTQKILPELESFLSFISTHDVFDAKRKKILNYLPKLAKAFQDTDSEPYVFVICKN